MGAFRVRTGVVLHRDGGWLVVTDVNGERDYYGRPGGGRFATEFAAEAAASRLSRAIRVAVADMNGKVSS